MWCDEVHILKKSVILTDQSTMKFKRLLASSLNHGTYEKQDINNKGHNS